MNVTGGISRSTHLFVTVAMSLVVVAAACTGGADDHGGSVAWSADPCGLAPPQDVAGAFGANPRPVPDAPAGECRYDVDGVVMRLIVLADGDTCTGAARTYASLGQTLAAPEGGADGVFVTEPGGDVVVCSAEVTYILSADGRSDALLELATTSPSQRRD